MNTIITENLAKYYGNVHAVAGISLSVRKSEIYGFLGLNGAGKTTTIRMLLGLIRPSSGKAYINDKRVHAGNISIWKDTGHLVEMPYAYPELTVRENLEIVRRLRFVQDKNAVEDVMNRLRLLPYAERKAKNLSLGNAQRLGLAKALIHKPRILFLDEPANGLDPAGILEIRELLRDLAENHDVTIFISSHILGEISKFATRIGIIHAGLLVQEVNAAELEKLCRRRLLVNAHVKANVIELLAKHNIIAKETTGDILEISNKKAIQHPENIATLMVKAGLPPTLLKVEEEDLESYFLRTIGLKGGQE